MKRNIFRMLLILILIAFTGCATIMEPKKKTVAVQSNQKMKVRYDNELVGSGKFVSFQALNRADGRNKMIVAESIETGEIRSITPTYTTNGWIFADILLDWGIISIPTDLVSGGYKRIDQTNYYIEFDEDLKESEKI